MYTEDTGTGIVLLLRVEHFRQARVSVFSSTALLRVEFKFKYNSFTFMSCVWYRYTTVPVFPVPSLFYMLCMYYLCHVCVGLQVAGVHRCTVGSVVRIPVPHMYDVIFI